MASDRRQIDTVRPHETTNLFTEVVAACGLASVLGPGAVRRALHDIGASPVPTVDDYRRALPRLQMRLAVYLSPEEAAKRARVIEELLERQAAGPSG